MEHARITKRLIETFEKHQELMSVWDLKTKVHLRSFVLGWKPPPYRCGIGQSSRVISLHWHSRIITHLPPMALQDHHSLRRHARWCLTNVLNIQPCMPKRLPAEKKLNSQWDATSSTKPVRILSFIFMQKVPSENQKFSYEAWWQARLCTWNTVDNPVVERLTLHWKP